MKVFYAGMISLVMCSLAACDKAPSQTPPTAASSQSTMPDPQAFLANLYSHYNSNPADTSFSPTGAQAPQWFDREMAALLGEDARLANGEVGALDGDPVCDCQDFGKLSANIKIEQAGATVTIASVIVTETDPSFNAEARQSRTLTYELIRQDGEWRIHDIGTKDIPSLHDWLARSNAEANSR